MFNSAVLSKKWRGKNVFRLRLSLNSTIKKDSVNTSSSNGDQIQHVPGVCVDKKLLNVTIRLNEKEVGEDWMNGGLNFSKGVVYYKDDEERFSQQHTVKLKTQQMYTVTLESDQIIMYVTLGGKTYNCFKMMTSSSSNVKVYQFVWLTKGLKITERKHRTVLSCIIKFQHYEELKFDLLTKFYESDDINHVSEGQGLSSIRLECVVGCTKNSKTALTKKLCMPMLKT